jgi:hypothetical protein
MRNFIDDNPVTAAMFALLFLVAGVGGVLIIFDQAGSMSYEDYTNILTKMALALGLLGIGKGVKTGLENHAVLKSLDAPVTDPSQVARDRGDAGRP